MVPAWLVQLELATFQVPLPPRPLGTPPGVVFDPSQYCSPAPACGTTRFTWPVVPVSIDQSPGLKPVGSEAITSPLLVNVPP